MVGSQGKKRPVAMDSAQATASFISAEHNGPLEDR